MTIPSGTDSARRVPLLRVAAIAGLTLISAAVVIHHVALSHLTRQIEGEETSAQLRSLDERLATLTQHVDTQRQQPAALTQARYETERQALADRLSALEQALADHDATHRQHTQQQQALDARVAQLAAQADTAAAAPRRRASAPAIPARAEPPFHIVGVEQRAEEQLLSILPTGASTLSHVRLLRPGESEAGWRLDAIEADHAVFQHGDARRRVPVPAPTAP